MAYMNQEKKKKIQAELKKVIPSGWKWSLSVRHHMAIVLTIWQGPKELTINGEGETADHRQLNEYYLDRAFQDPKTVETFQKINEALNLDNFNNSDPMTDYFHVGHYVDIEIGRWDKPYVVIETEPVKATAETEPEPADLAVDFFQAATADPIVETAAEPVTVDPTPKQAKTAVKRTRKPAAKKQAPKQAKTVKGKAKAVAVTILQGWLARLQV